MAYLAADVANQALDAIGSRLVIGDLEEGTRHAQVLLRAYGQCLRQLLRSAHWDFARKSAPLTLLADRTGQTPNVPTQVIQPWRYEYQYPIDCMKIRFIPFNYINAPTNIPPTNIQLHGTPPVQGRQPYIRLTPTRFLVAMDYNYPPQSMQEWWEVQGVSPTGRTVICSDVKWADAVYTAFIPYPSVWDAQFRAAFVAYLASEVAIALVDDPRQAAAVQAQQIRLATSKIKAARVSDGNEMWANSDINVDWLSARGAGAYGTGFGHGGGFGGDGFTGGGGFYGGWESIGFSDGSSY